jgi:hypothetical protein
MLFTGTTKILLCPEAQEPQLRKIKLIHSLKTVPLFTKLKAVDYPCCTFHIIDIFISEILCHLKVLSSEIDPVEIRLIR